jgi:hypothetical protein
MQLVGGMHGPPVRLLLLAATALLCTARDDGESSSLWAAAIWSRLDGGREAGAFPVRRYSSAAAALGSKGGIVLTHGYYYDGDQPGLHAPIGSEGRGPLWLNDTWVWRGDLAAGNGQWNQSIMPPGAPIPASR